jgi:hypothetical protein
MASIRELKKEINHLVVHIIEQAFQYQVTHPSGKGYDEADKIIEESVALRDDTIDAIYNADELENKQLKSHFSTLKEDFQKKSLELIDRLDKLPD